MTIWAFVAQRVYAESRQAEAGQYKDGDLTRFGAIMDRIGREARSGN